MTVAPVHRTEIAIANLDLDCENPRHGAVADQDEALSRLIADQGDKIGRLAVDIHRYGLSPAQLFIVTNGSAGRFCVLDGNRRLAALRILADPNLLPVELHPPGFITAVNQPGNQPSQVMCAIVPNRDEARLWLNRTHSGQLNGIGTIPWTSAATYRFNPNQSLRGHTASAISVLDWLRHRLPTDDASRAHLDSVETRSVTNLGRLTSDPAIRKLVGFEFQDGTVALNDDEPAVVRRLLTLIEKLADGASVTELKNKTLRARFAARHLGDDTHSSAPHPPDDSDTDTDTGDTAPPAAPEDGSGEGASAAAADTSTRPRRRHSAAHPFADIDTTPMHTRIQQIITEIETLNPDRHPNATAVLLRAIVELTVTEYLQSQGMTPRREDKLASNVRNAMTQLGIANDDDDFRPLRTHLQQQFSIISVPNLHQYVHNVHAAPGQSDLNSIAVAYRPLLEAICAALR